MNELTNERLKEIEARCEKATPGPWLRATNLGCRDIGTRQGQRGIYALFCTSGIDDPEDRHNAEFIAHARQDVPDLLRELRTLREQTRWRDVKDELPKIGQWVHVVCDGVVQRQAAYLTTADFAPEVGPTEYCWMWADESADTAPFEAVSHWQPLPQEPK